MPAHHILQTDRLIIREFSLEDAQGFYEMNLEPAVLQYTGDRPFTTVEEARVFIQSYNHYQEYGYGRWTLIHRSSEQYLGFCGFKYHPDSAEVDLGFRIPLPFWGQGFATEAAQGCLAYGLAQLGFSRVIGRVAQANKASIRVLEKVGMQYVQSFDFDGMPGFLYETHKPHANPKIP